MRDMLDDNQQFHMRAMKMKKISMAALLLVATITLVACGQSGDDSASTPKVAEANKAATPEKTDSLTADAVQPMSAQALAEVKPGTAACAFDSVDGNYSANEARLDKSSAHVFRGWALAEDKHVAKEIRFVLKGAEDFVISVKSGVDRPDVGSHFNDPSLNSAGFNFSTTLNAVPAGAYHVLLVTQLGDVSYSCETKKRITVF
ncbi:MAG: hypothetical protein J0I74_11405 [Rhodanobacter sp.]|nr:hypothetical protein [Rhodanobacter sp.]